MAARRYCLYIYQRRPVWVLLGMFVVVLLYIVVNQQDGMVDEHNTYVMREKRLLHKNQRLTENAIRGNRSDTVNVYVVEEHHEVLPYWYRETKNKNLRPSMNTLIHIDAHSDLAIPFLLPGFPQFRLPDNDQEITTMMQKNDVFILGALSTGLFDRIIWIYPSWDRENHRSEPFYSPDYEKLLFGVGSYMPKNATDQKQLCQCVRDLVPPFAIGCELQEDMYADDGQQIPPSHCHKPKYAMVEIIEERVAMDMLQQGTLLKGSPSMILDVDEDFFGCASGFDKLDKAGLDETTTDQINTVLSLLMCPKSTYYEELADKTLKNFIRDFIKLCLVSSEELKCEQQLDSFLDVFHANKAMFCEKEPSYIIEIMGQLLEIFSRMPVKRLEAIADVGFCLGTSPATYRPPGIEDLEYREYQMCHGNNLPNRTVVTLHTPKKTALKKSMRNVYTMLDHIQAFKPRVVTVCRSVRDGYTPRSMTKIIEKGILKYFPDNGKRLTGQNFRIVYDKNLLGGEAGWEGRYRA